jgi:hypothetical protein
MSEALCKFRGMLVIMKVSQCEGEGVGSCPECGATKFHTINGWVECDCGFAINKPDYERITGKAA